MNETRHTDLLRECLDVIEWLHPDDGAITMNEPCVKETPDDCCMECRYLGCLDMKMRAVKKALSDEEKSQ